MLDARALESAVMRPQIGYYDTNSFRFAELKSWLEEHVEPLSGSG